MIDEEIGMLVTREFLSKQKFRVFTPNDYHGFSGVNSPVPLMAEGDDYIVIIDGSYCEIYSETEDGDWDQVATCDDITLL